MAVPKRRTSLSNTHSRRSQWKTSAPKLTKCPKCGETCLPHNACPSCGTYRDKVYVKAQVK